MKDPCFALFTKAKALAPDIDRRGVVQEAVEHGSSQHGVRDHLSPLAVGFVAGQDKAAFLVATANEPEQELG